MEKQKIINDYKKQEDKLLISRVLDKIESCKKTNNIEYTDFLDMYEISLVRTFLKKIDFCNYKLFGGYEGSERKLLIIYPEKYDEKMLEKNYKKMISVIRIVLPDKQETQLSHRNYLGGIVKVGMKREKVGDILVADDGADILVKTETAQSLINELEKLTRFDEAEFNVIELTDLREKVENVEEISIIVPSLRLDNFVSDLAKTSRSKAVQIIESERVFINGKNELKPAKQIKCADIITIRGKGRFIVQEFAGTTRSGRTIVKIQKFS